LTADRRAALAASARSATHACACPTPRAGDRSPLTQDGIKWVVEPQLIARHYLRGWFAGTVEMAVVVAPQLALSSCSGCI